MCSHLQWQFKDPTLFSQFQWILNGIWWPQGVRDRRRRKHIQQWGLHVFWYRVLHLILSTCTGRRDLSSLQVNNLDQKFRLQFRRSYEDPWWGTMPFQYIVLSVARIEGCCDLRANHSRDLCCRMRFQRSRDHEARPQNRNQTLQCGWTMWWHQCDIRLVDYYPPVWSLSIWAWINQDCRWSTQSLSWLAFHRRRLSTLRSCT